MSRLSVGLAGLVLLLGTGIKSGYSAVHGYSDYSWLTYNGHQYAVTFDYNTWAGADAEAKAVGGHLAAINDSAENDFLTLGFGGYYISGHAGNPWSSLVWIGLHQQGSNEAGSPYQPSGEWLWTSGEPVTYVAPRWAGRWEPAGLSHAYLHTSTHPNPGTWYNSI